MEGEIYGGRDFMEREILWRERLAKHHCKSKQFLKILSSMAEHPKGHSRAMPTFLTHFFSNFLLENGSVFLHDCLKFCIKSVL